jgi:hypothetical protein
MRTHLLTGIICLACSSFMNSDNSILLGSGAPGDKTIRQNVFNLTVHRLSGERVIVSWHYEGEPLQTRFELMRKHGPDMFYSLGTVEPKLREDNSADYSFIDSNDFADSTFYCVKKTGPDSVVFFSITRGVEGVGKER